MAESISFKGKSLEFRQEFWKQKESSHPGGDFRKEMKMLDFSGDGAYCNQFTFELNERAVRGYYILRETSTCNVYSIHTTNLKDITQRVFALKERMPGKGYKFLPKDTPTGDSIQSVASMIATAVKYIDRAVTATLNAVNYLPVIDPVITPSIKLANTTLKLGILMAKGIRGWDGLAVSFRILDVSLKVRLERLEILGKDYKLSYSFEDHPSGACSEVFSEVLSEMQVAEFFKCCFAFVMEPYVGVLSQDSGLVGHTLSMQECISFIKEGQQFWRIGWRKKDMVLLGKLNTETEELDAVEIMKP